MPKHFKRADHARNSGDARGTVRIVVYLTDPVRGSNFNAPKNRMMSMRIRDATVSEVYRAVEKLLELED